jgi:4-amino-4-deoxy-L-arabinose transferase-like glycosyltransferase
MMLARLSIRNVLTGFVLTLYFLLIGNKLMRLGIHGDGLEYGTVARNMADGLGTFWRPYLEDFIHPVFHEHPPLVFWIQSIFFRLFGDGPYLENFYGCLAGLVTLGCMAWFWQRVRRDSGLSSVGVWWPMLLMVPLPLFTYTMQTNRIAATYIIFAILPTYAAYRSVTAAKHTVLFSLVAGVLIYLGFIAKGPVAFFTFAVPAIAWLTIKSKLPRAVLSTLLAMAAFTAILFTVFYLFPDSKDFWKGFWNAQIVASLKSQRAPGDTHWYLVERWAAEMAVPVFIAAVFMTLNRVPLREIKFNRPAWFFLLIGLASSLPFLISMRQHNRYIFHSYPFFVLSVAFATDSIAAKIESLLGAKPKFKIAVGVIGVIFFIAAFTSMLVNKGHVRGRKPFFYDIYLQNIQLPQHTTISVCPQAMILNDWLFADMMRFYKNSLTPAMGQEYLIVAKDSGCTVPPGYREINQPPRIKYIFYQKDKPAGHQIPSRKMGQ